jgi:hypothetical protein
MFSAGPAGRRQKKKAPQLAYGGESFHVKEIQLQRDWFRRSTVGQ